MSQFVYGTIVTMVATGELQFESNAETFTSILVILVGGIAIWLAHAVSQLVAVQASSHRELTVTDVGRALARSWPIVLAAVPAAMVMVLAGVATWTTSMGLTVASGVEVVALAAIGVATAGGAERSLWRRVFYVTWVTGVGVLIVGLELAIHHI